MTRMVRRLGLSWQSAALKVRAAWCLPLELTLYCELLLVAAVVGRLLRPRLLLLLQPLL